MTLFCDWEPTETPVRPGDEHIHDEGACCECGGDHCCGSSLCLANAAPPEDTRPCGCPEDYHLADCPLRYPGSDE